MKTLGKLIVSLAALTFLAAGLEFWFVPEQAAQHFGLEATSGFGLVSMRAEFGGLIAASVVLAAIVVGRTVGWVVTGGADIGAIELAIELAALAGLTLLARSLGGTPEASQAHDPHQPLKIALASLGVLALVSGVALLTPSVQQEVFDRAAVQLSARTNDAPLADDALRVAIAGSSAPLPSRSRAKASVVVFAGGRFWVVDSGPESVENLMLWGIPMSKIGGVLLTHFHSDHIGDLGELQLQTWAGGRAAPLAVYGGPGVDTVVAGFNTAYRQDQGYRTAHHGEKVMPSAAWGMVAHTVLLDGPPTPAKDRTGLVYDDGTLRITAIEVDHKPITPAYAYRFDYKGRSAVITGDLKYHPPLVKSAANADLMVSEAISRSMTRSLEQAARAGSRERTAAIMHDVQDYHISPEEAAQIANDAHVKLLAYYHLLPAPDGFLPRRLFSSGVNKVRKGGWTMADDGSLYTLPLGSTAVRVGRM